MDPPVTKDNSISMEPIESSPRIYHVPDVLPLSASNHAFRVYEDIETPQGGQSAKSQLQRQNAVDMPATQQLSHQPREPAAPEKQRKMSTQSASSAPPVPTTRRPSDVIPSRRRSFERSLTDTSEPPPVPSARRPSQCDTTAPNTRRFRSLSEDSPMQVTGFTNTRPLVFGSGRDDPRRFKMLYFRNETDETRYGNGNLYKDVLFVYLYNLMTSLRKPSMYYFSLA